MRWPFSRKPKPPAVDIAVIVKETAQETVDALERKMWADSPAPGAPTANMTTAWQKSPFPVYNNNNPWKFYTPIAPTRRPDSIVSVEDLRLFAERYDVLRACIQHLKREVFAVPLQFVAKDEKDQSTETQAQIKQAEEFFSTRGGLGGFGRTRKSYEGMIIEDLCVIGTAAVWFQQNRAQKPFQAIPFDAATIRPRVDAYGWPGPGDVFYEQWVMGLKIGNGFTMQEMFYGGLPTSDRSYSPYPASPVEWLIATIMRGMKSDEWNLSWLTEGTSSDQYFTLPESFPPPEVQAYAEWHTAMLKGNTQQRQAAVWLPFGTAQIGQKAPRKDQDFEQLQLDAARRTGAIMGVQLASIGWTGEQYKVSQENSMDATSEFGAGVLLEFRSDHYNDMLDRMGLDLICCRNVTEREEKATERAQRLKDLDGVLTPNEKRAEEGKDPIDGGDTLFIPTTLTPIEHALIPPPDPLEMAKAKAVTSPAIGADGKPKAESKRLALEWWERKVLNRLKAGKSAACEFESDVLTDEERETIGQALTRCEGVDDVRALFSRQSLPIQEV